MGVKLSLKNLNPLSLVYRGSITEFWQILYKNIHFSISTNIAAVSWFWYRSVRYIFRRLILAFTKCFRTEQCSSSSECFRIRTMFSSVVPSTCSHAMQHRVRPLRQLERAFHATSLPSPCPTAWCMDGGDNAREGNFSARQRQISMKDAARIVQWSAKVRRRRRRRGGREGAVKGWGHSHMMSARFVDTWPCFGRNLSIENLQNYVFYTLAWRRSCFNI